MPRPVPLQLFIPKDIIVLHKKNRFKKHTNGVSFVDPGPGSTVVFNVVDDDGIVTQTTFAFDSSDDDDYFFEEVVSA